MDIRYPVHQDAVKHLNTDQLREHFHIPTLFQPDALLLTYTHIDRVIIGGAAPVSQPVSLQADAKTLGAAFFLERREIGIINVGGEGSITADGTTTTLKKQDGLYIGMGTREVVFTSADASHPAHFFFFSAPAHTTYPTVHIDISQAEPVHLGTPAASNVRTIYKYIHPDGVKSCQIVMGLTQLEPNNMWNTMPAHTHSRRMEAYFYFNLEGDNIVFHLMGEPDETRHIVMRNEQAVISPSWSIHAGMGTSNYTFIWAMAGENQSFSDMDAIPMSALR
ncbi:MAG: 5-dehydro-4-deoxy-D-glucuronate isomerase [Anaerolineae bacterium]